MSDTISLLARYDAIFLDLWGVVHDGSQLYPGVHGTLTALRNAGKKIVMISNAPRRAHVVEKRLNELGVEKELYDGVMSSGEAGYQWLASRQAPWGPRYYYLGDTKDENILEGLPYERVGLENASFIINTGFGTDYKPVGDSQGLLKDAHERELPMLCLNPDLEVVKMDGSRHPCAGAIAREYVALGGEVTWFGKPYEGVYNRAMAMVGSVPRNRIVGVGDSLETDIPGAQNFGIDSMLVTGGILKGNSEAQIASMCAELKLRPTYVRAAF